MLRDPPPGFPYPHAGSVAATPADVEPLRALYDECVASADARLGAWLAQLRELADALNKSAYGKYLLSIVED